MIESNKNPQINSGMLHYNIADSVSRIEAFLTSNPESTISLFLDYDDTISFYLETDQKNCPAINEHAVRYVSELFKRFGADKFEFAILSSRANDKLIEAVCGRHHTIAKGYEHFYAMLLQMVDEKSTLPSLSELLKPNHIHCLKGYDQVHLYAPKKIFWSSKLFSKTDETTAENYALEANKLCKESNNSNAYVMQTEAFKAHYLLHNLNYQTDRFFIFIDDSKTQIKMMQITYPNALCIQVEPVPRAATETAAVSSSATQQQEEEKATPVIQQHQTESHKNRARFFTPDMAFDGESNDAVSEYECYEAMQ